MDYLKDEKIIAEAILHGRKVQDYLWQEISLLKKPYEPILWEKVFQKRVDKISEIDVNSASHKVELRKRILQQAALSVMALLVLDSDS